MQKMKISGSMLDRAKKAEEILARAEAKGIGDFLPDDHPLKGEVERQKAVLGGDLAGLPPGHPLARALEAAKREYEAKKAAEEAAAAEGKAGEKTGAGPRKAKKVDPDAARKAARLRADEDADRRRTVAAEINGRVEVVRKASKELYEAVVRSEEVLGTDPFSRAKASRLKRLMFAMERGVADCRIVRA